MGDGPGSVKGRQRAALGRGKSTHRLVPFPLLTMTVLGLGRLFKSIPRFLAGGNNLTQNSRVPRETSKLRLGGMGRRGFRQHEGCYGTRRVFCGARLLRPANVACSEK